MIIYKDDLFFKKNELPIYLQDLVTKDLADARLTSII